MTRLLLAVNEAQRTGAPMSALFMLRRLDAAAHTTVVIKRAGPMELDFAERADAVVVQPGGVVYPWLVRLRFRGLPIGGQLDRRFAGQILREVQPDAVYADTVVTAEYAALAIESGLPTVMHIRELDPALRTFLRVTGQPEKLRRADLVANSQTTAHATARALACDPEAVTVAYPPVDAAAVRRLATAGEPTIVAPVVGCGTTSRVKGADRLPDLLAALTRTTADPPTLAWIGDGPLQARLRRHARGLAPPRLLLPGALDNPYPILAAAQVIVIPSRQEPLSRVALEALALGRAVVAFDVGGLHEVIGDAGILVRAGDIEAMAAAVARLLGDSEARAELGRRGQVRVRDRFSVEQHLAVMAGVLAPLGLGFPDGSSGGHTDAQAP